jgi:hypothetical protein
VSSARSVIVGSNKIRRVYPHIENPDFNPVPYLFLIIMNRFLRRTFEKSFGDETNRITFALALQEVVHRALADELICYHMEFINNTRFRNKDASKSDVLNDVNHVFLDSHSDETLYNLFINGEADFQDRRISLNSCFNKDFPNQLLRAHICSSTLRAMNWVSGSVCSYKTLHSVTQTCWDIENFLGKVDLGDNWVCFDEGEIAQF